jgi:hypothetical protein
VSVVKRGSWYANIHIQQIVMGYGYKQGRNQKRSVRDVRVKKIKCLDQKKYHFLLHKFYFSANQEVSGRRLAPTLVPPLGTRQLPYSVSTAGAFALITGSTLLHSKFHMEF